MNKRKLDSTDNTVDNTSCLKECLDNSKDMSSHNVRSKIYKSDGEPYFLKSISSDIEKVNSE